MSQQGCGHHHHYHLGQLWPWVDRRVFIEFRLVYLGIYTSSQHTHHHQGHLGTRTVSILQSSLGSRSHSSAGMFCTSWRASSRQTWTDAWSLTSIAQNCVCVWKKSPFRCSWRHSWTGRKCPLVPERQQLENIISSESHSKDLKKKNDPGAHSILLVIRKTDVTHLPAGSFRIHLLHSFFLEGALEV